MRLLRFALVALALPAVACVSPGTPRVVSDAAVLDLGAANGRTAMVSLAAPASGYVIQATDPVHRWVPADIVQYDVTLKIRDGANFVDLPGPVTVSVKVKDGQSKAVFANLRQGAFYRALVVAKGNKDGVAANPLVTLNGNTEAKADFDFTDAQNVAPTINQTVTIAFDDVPFSGTAGLTFGTPPEGKFATPAAGPSASATTTPAP